MNAVSPPAGGAPGVSSGTPRHLVRPEDRVVGRLEWMGFIAMVVGMFMAILDIQIVASSLAQIGAGISASLDETSWIQSAYLIAEVVMIPLSGWLARLLSTRVLFTISCASFTVASAACALSWSITSMAALRALQGFLGGAMIPTVFASAFRIFPPRLQPRVSVVIGLVATMGPTLGPTLGGWLTDNMSWHWLFLVNIVPGIIVTTAVFSLVRVDEPNLELLKGFDLPGIVLVAGFLGCLQYVLEQGPRDGWFGDRTIFTMACISGASAFFFFWRELTTEHPVIDLRALADRNFAAGCFFSFVIGVGLYGTVYAIPLFLAEVRQFDALEIGVIMMVVGVFQFLSAPLAGFVSKHIPDLRLMLVMGLSMFAVAVWMNAHMTSEWAWDQFLIPQALRGLSLMFCFLPVNQIALGYIPFDKLQNASGLYNLMRNLGGAIGLATINTVLTDRFALHYERLGASITAARPPVLGTLEGLAHHLVPRLGVEAPQAAFALVTQGVKLQATVMSFNDVLLLISALFAGALLAMPLVRKVRTGHGGGH